MRCILVGSLMWLVGCTCQPDSDSAVREAGHHPSLLAEVSPGVDAFTVSPEGVAWYAADGSVQRVDGAGASLPTLPPGAVTFMTALSDDVLLARVHGKGLFRVQVGDDAWQAAQTGLTSALLTILNPTAVPVPIAAHVEGEHVWLAAGGGLYRSTDVGQSWVPISTASSGNINVAFTDVVAKGDTVIAVSLLPESLIPSAYQGLLSGRVFSSTDGGEHFVDRAPDFPSNHATSVALADDGTLYVGTLDQGVLVEAEGWRSIGGPTDVVALDAWAGGLTVGSATRGVFRLDGDVWSHAGGAPTVAIERGLAVDIEGRVYEILPGPGDPPPEPAGGTVHVALSFHGNFYHSYRGDSPTDDGYGQDIRVIRSTLDWLDDYPEVRAHWDFDNYWTTDQWMPSDSPDLLQRIGERVADGTDGIRLMSWNNGAMASQTREEFAASVEWAKLSNTEAFGAFSPGVQPQECMFTPEHVDWYTEHGIDWVTLFYAGNAFTALRSDVTLVGRELYSPATLVNPDSGAEMTWIPAYHHADLIDHGGLVGWVRQISAQYPGDSLLLVHFDADAETWEHFDIEIADAVDEPALRWTALDAYLETHPPVARVEIQGDVADGTGDGFQSWAEKDFNHVQFTHVADARRRADLARILGDGDAEVSSLLEQALPPRLLALSTTNYGLAMPYLHEDRYVAAAAQATEAIEAAQDALDAAERLRPVANGELEVVNPRPSTGAALLRFEVRIPIADFTDPERVRIFDGVDELPRRVTHLGEDSGDARVQVELVHAVAAESIAPLSWVHAAEAASVSGGLPPVEAPEAGPVMAPFIDCDGSRVEGARDANDPVAHTSPSGTVAWWTEVFTLPACEASGTLSRTYTAFAGLPGTVVDVEATLGVPDDPSALQSVVLSPVSCLGGATEITWQTFGGAVQTRPARAPVEAWNGQSVDGWLQITCADGPDWQIAHDTTVRTSLAFAPLYNEGGEAFVAPLGTLYGSPPWHHPRRTGGHGYGDLLVPVVADTFQPAAPDWAGAEVTYRLLIGEDLTRDQRDLFAHPPEVRVGD